MRLVVHGLLSMVFLTAFALGLASQAPADLLMFSYKGIRLLETPRVMGPKHTLDERTVFCANISAETNVYLFNGTLSLKQKMEAFEKVKYEIFIADEDGDHQRRLTWSKSGALSFAPRLSPDAKTIIYKEIHKTEDYVKRYPDEMFTNIPRSPRLFYTSEFAVVSGPFTINYFRYHLPDGPAERLTVSEADAFYSGGE